MSLVTHRLPFSLLDLTLAQAQACQRINALSRVIQVRQAHSTALQTKAPEVREGYLSPPLPGRGDVERRRSASIAKDARRPAPKTRQSETVRAPSAAALLLHDRVDSLVKHTGGDVRSPNVGSNKQTSSPTSRVNLIFLQLYTEGAQENEIAYPENESYTEGRLYYAETDLRDFYTDLLTHPESELEAQARFFPTKTRSRRRELEEIDNKRRKERREVLDSARSRLIVDNDGIPSEAGPSSSSSLASRLAGRRKTSRSSEFREGELKQDLLVELREQLDPKKLHHNILLRVLDVVESVEEARKVVNGPGTRVAGTPSTPVVVLSPKEWDALVHTCIDDNELSIAEVGLLLMKRCGNEPPEELVNDVLNAHASEGDVPAVLAFFEKLAIGRPTERQRDLHIKAHLKSSPSSTYGIPSALEVLHKYESLALLPPVQSYTRLICALFSARSAQLQAQAWDLFAHMRYVAHAKPDPALYALMIRACAGTGFSQSGYVADPVRALDLWTEMTTDVGHAPTVGAYNAIILACARSSEYVGEAFRLAREMLDGHRDAYGYPLMHATQETFDALLVAAKTRKDLPRARWILAEMLKIYEQAVKQSKETGKEIESEIELNERTLMHVFHAYASYRPPFRRGDTAIIDESEVKVTPQEANVGSVGEHSAPQKELEKVSSTARFTVTPPQTRKEVLAEADALFERILAETDLHPSSPRAPSGDPQTSAQGPFSRVLLTTSLLNSYLSAHYMHDTLENSHKLYKEVFLRTGVEHSPRTYIEALERCAGAEREERGVAKEFAEGVWREWIEVERRLNPRTVDARMIERAYAAMIRLLALVRDLDSSLSLLRTFSTRYPPRAVSHPLYGKPEIRSTRTSLYDTDRPLVRLTTPSEVPDDTVPPLLTPRDLELLHHRLVEAGPGRQKDLDRLTYLGYAYMGALRKRRDRVIRA
ncbi:hypothetical protein ACEPAF_9015 [Sanghuangporus sanghuang]